MEKYNQQNKTTTSSGWMTRRFGKPRTEEERKKRHKGRFGTTKLPPRGTGLKNK